MVLREIRKDQDAAGRARNTAAQWLYSKRVPRRRSCVVAVRQVLARSIRHKYLGPIAFGSECPGLLSLWGSIPCFGQYHSSHSARCCNHHASKPILCREKPSRKYTDECHLNGLRMGGRGVNSQNVADRRVGNLAPPILDMGCGNTTRESNFSH